MATDEVKEEFNGFIDIYELYNRHQARFESVTIDVRAKQDYKASHIEHALNIPIGTEETQIIQIIKQCKKTNNTEFVNTMIRCDILLHRKQTKRG